MDLIALLNAYVENGGTLPDGVIEMAERLLRAEVQAPPEGEEATAEHAMLVWADGDEPLTDDELTQVRDALTQLGEDPDVPVDLILAAADTVQIVATENDARDAVAVEAQEARDAAVARLREAGGGDDDETADAEGDAEGDETASADDTVEDPESGGDGDDADVSDDDREAVTAGGTPRGRRVSRDALLRARPRARAGRPGSEPEPSTPAPTRSPIVFAHGVPDVAPGSETYTLHDVDRALERRRSTFRRSGTAGRPNAERRPAKGGKDRPTNRGRLASEELASTAEAIPVATIQGQFPESRMLCDADGQSLSPGEITRRIAAEIDRGIDETRAAAERAGAPGALVAAGGLCVLPTPLYNIETMGITTRPIRDQALVSFQAARGGVTDLSPPTLPDLAGAVSQWTVANDESATDGDPVKPCLRVECGDPRTTQIYAVPVCLTVGNFLARTYGELQQAWSRLALVSQARFAEALLFARLQTLSTTVTNLATDWSAARDVLAILDQAAAGMRSRHRLEDDFPFVVILPTVLLTILRTDILRQMPTGNLRETMALANAEITAWFAARSITPIWSPDVNVIGTQGATVLAHLPPTINWVMYPAGTFIHLDGGDLDLGVMRDTATTATNDFQIFSESFENVHKVGPESLAGTIDVCPSGAVSGTIDPAPWCASYT